MFDGRENSHLAAAVKEILHRANCGRPAIPHAKRAHLYHIPAMPQNGKIGIERLHDASRVGGEFHLVE
jgi:hypothetical protein